MNQLIENYIYDVTRRLKESERADVSRELEASIMDMLPDSYGEEQVEDVLIKLGEPRLMAEQYRSNPRYLISPAMFDMYLTVLKMVVAIVAGTLACISGIVTLFNTYESFSFVSFFAAILEGAITGALQAAFWVTLGFALTDYFHAGERTWTIAGYTIYKKKEWAVKDLPKAPKVPESVTKGNTISRASTIGGMIGTLFITVLIVMMIVRDEWFLVIVKDTNIINPFTDTALYRFIPFLIITSVISLAVQCLKLYYARWNLPLFIVNAIYNFIWVGIVIYVVHWPDLFNPEFIPAITPHLNVNDNDLFMRFLSSDGRGFRFAFSSLMAIAGIIDIISSAVYALKGNRS